MDAVPLIRMESGCVFEFPYSRLDIKPDPAVPGHEVHWFYYA
jgi:hypothetical protein